MLIPLSPGGKHGDGRMKYALIDAADYPLVRDRKWYANWNQLAKTWYAATLARVSEGRGMRYLHRAILGLGPGDRQEGDHVNRTPLDNRRLNLRVATSSQNLANRRRWESASGFKGVTRARGRWHARINMQGRTRNLGYFTTREEAARAYDAAARDLHGEFGQANGTSG